MSIRDKTRDPYVPSNPGLHLIYWPHSASQEQVQANPYAGPIIAWLFSSTDDYPTPITPSGGLGKGLYLYAILSSDDGSVFWPYRDGHRFANLAAWLNDPCVNEVHADYRYAKLHGFWPDGIIERSFKRWRALKSSPLRLVSKG